MVYTSPVKAMYETKSRDILFTPHKYVLKDHLLDNIADSDINLYGYRIYRQI